MTPLIASIQIPGLANLALLWLIGLAVSVALTEGRKRFNRK